MSYNILVLRHIQRRYIIMKIAIFDAKQYDREFFDKENNGRHAITYFEENLSLENLDLAKGFDAVSGFVNTPADADILKGLSERGVKVWLQRSMGYNRVDIKAAEEHGISVFRVFNYSAETVSEHAVSLMMAANRRLVKASARTTIADFSLNGLQGKCINDSVVGVVGAGKIGQGFIKAMKGLGARVIVFDKFAEEHFNETADKLGFEWVDFDYFLNNSDFISLHAPFIPGVTEHMINAEAVSKMKDGVIIVNAARGGLIDTTALVDGLKSGKIAAAGLDVIEREAGKFFFDRSNELEEIKAEDAEWKFLMESEDVIITAHQAFFSELALTQIAQTTLAHADEFEAGDLSQQLLVLEDGKIQNG